MIIFVNFITRRHQFCPPKQNDICDKQMMYPSIM